MQSSRSCVAFAVAALVSAVGANTAEAAFIAQQLAPESDAGIFYDDWPATSQLSDAVGLLKSGQRIEGKRKLAAFLRQRPRDPRGPELAGIILLEEKNYKASVLSFRQAISLGGDRASVRSKLGVALMLGGDRSAGEAELVEAIRRDKGDLLANRYLAWIAETRGDFQDAARRYEAALTSRRLPAGTLTEFHVAAARLYNSAGQPAQTVRVLGDIVERSKDPRLVQLAHVLLANALLDLDRGDMAAPLIQELAHRLKPDDPDLLLLQGFQGMKKDPAGARAKLERLAQVAPAREGQAMMLIARSFALERNYRRAGGIIEDLAAKAAPPSLYGVLSALTAMHRAAGQTKLALPTIQRYALRYPERPELTVLAGEILAETGASDEAVRTLEELLRKHPRYSAAAMALGRLQLARGKPDEAASSFESVVFREADHAEAWLALADARRAAGKDALADAALEKGLAANPDDVPLLFAQGLRHHAQGKGEAAQANFDRVLALQPDHVGAMIHRSIELAESGADLKRAREMSGRALARAKNDPEAMDAHGWVLALAGEYKESIALLEQVAKAHPNEPVVAYHLGAARVMAGKPAEGRPTLERAIALGLPEALRQKARGLLR